MDLGMEDVVKCTVYLSDIADSAAFGPVWNKHFAEPKPARAAVGVSGLAFGGAVELECMVAAAAHKEGQVILLSLTFAWHCVSVLLRFVCGYTSP